MSQSEHFESLFAGNPDPWGYEWRWYEQRKRSLLLASLPRRRFRACFEPGCANGVLTSSLAERCERLLASDASESAVRLAHQRLASLPWVRIERRSMPTDWPREETFDLVVLSELLYYLDLPQLEKLIERARASLSDDAVLVACNWKGDAPDRLIPTPHVHKMLADLGLPSLARHEEQDFLLEVWTMKSTSVAQEEGLV